MPRVRQRRVAGTVAEKAFENEVSIMSSPYDHLRACPGGRVLVTRRGCMQIRESSPRVSGGIVSAPRGELGECRQRLASPDDHLSASPDCSVQVSRFGLIEA